MHHLYHFDDYIQKHKKQSMHPKLNTLYSNFPTSVHNLKNLIFYGPVGVGKYTQALSCIRKYSPSELKYEKKLTINYDKEQYLIKMSDVHFEVDMSLLGCNAKLLWNEIHSQIVDVVISSLSHNQVGIIVCTHFHKINSELLDNFYSYMQGVNSKRFKYIIITEHIGFIPDNILNNCKTIHVPKPSTTNYSKCFIKNNEYDILKVKNNSLHASYISENSEILKNNKKESHCVGRFITPHENLCNNILEHIKNPNNISFLLLREMLYEILIYNYDLGECIWYIINDLIKHNYLNTNNLSTILIHTYTSLQYYNNNYRPIYHLENYVYNLITTIHNYKNYNEVSIATAK
jgi:DNA polymerase III delta prime subunit